MLIELRNLSGDKIAINSDALIFVRPSFGAKEPPKAVTLRLDKRRMHCAGKLDAMLAQLPDQMQLCRLSTPNGKPLCLNAARIIDVSPPPKSANPKAKAVVTLNVVGGTKITQQVLQTVDEVIAAQSASGT